MEWLVLIRLGYLVVISGCLAAPSYEGTAYKCEQDPVCPDGFTCIAGRCVANPDQAHDVATFPRGDFMMGCIAGAPEGCAADATPFHAVNLTGFVIELTEVTQAEYATCLADQLCTVTPTNFTPLTDPDLPVRGLNWVAAEAFCESRSRRLPTEAQWERAARNGNNGPYPWGAGVGCEFANAQGCGGTPVVESALPGGATADGIHHMGGNVREWVLDCYASDFYSKTEAAQNPMPSSCGTGGQHVIRGGGFNSTTDALTVWHRESLDTQQSADDLGFRCADLAP